MKTIFVHIASYRDPECQWTVKDLFAKAKHPQRVHVGICWQFDPEKDGDCFKSSERTEQVRIAPFHWGESEGVCWARHQAQQLWEGEDYVLSIDSHTRFAEDWDDRLIGELAECPSEKAVLSNHPANYTPARYAAGRRDAYHLARTSLFTAGRSGNTRREPRSRSPKAVTRCVLHGPIHLCEKRPHPRSTLRSLYVF